MASVRLDISPDAFLEMPALQARKMTVVINKKAGNRKLLRAVSTKMLSFAL
jgi:hypothetical protein